MNSYVHPLFALSQCLLLVGLVLKRSPYRWILWLLIAGINCCCFFSTQTDDPLMDEGLRNALVIYIFHASDYILLTDVQRELRVVGQREPISNAGFWSRLKWGLRLLLNNRGVGWVHEPKYSLPPHPDITRPQFLTSRLLRLATWALTNDMAHVMLRANPVFAKSAPPFAQQPWPWRFWSLLLIAVTQWCYLSIMHTFWSMVFVATGLSTPDLWPDAFGKWGDAYTIRRFWGRTWHQFMRRPFSAHGKYVARRVFRLPPDGKLSSYTQLYTTFLISAIIHNPPTHTGPFIFFILQACAITFEDVVIALAARIGLAKVHRPIRILGYIWVYCWFAYSMKWWLGYTIPMGINEYGGMKFSLIIEEIGILKGDEYF